MANPTSAQLQQRFETSRLALAAYGAEQVKGLLATNPSAHVLAANFVNILLDQGFTPEQANSFVSKYTPVAALDQEGAGAILFRDTASGEVAVAVRGTDWEHNFMNDLVLADSTIALNHLPVYQTTLIANFVLRETAPEGSTVKQFAVQGINSNADNLLSAVESAVGKTIQTVAPVFGWVANMAIQETTAPRLVVAGSAVGTVN